MNTFMDALTTNEKSYTGNGGTAYRTSASTLCRPKFLPFLLCVMQQLISMVKVKANPIFMERHIDGSRQLTHCVYLLHHMRRSFIYHEVAYVCTPH